MRGNAAFPRRLSNRSKTFLLGDDELGIGGSEVTLELMSCVCGIAARNATAGADGCKPDQRIKDLQISPSISNVAQNTQDMWIDASYIIVRVQTYTVPCLESMCLQSTNELSHSISSRAS